MSRRSLFVGLLVAGLLAACGGGGGVSPGGVLEWRNLTVDLPESWVEINRTSASVTIANARGNREEGLRGDQEVATQFLIDPNATTQQWRDFVSQQEGELLRDERIEIAGLPATLLEYEFTTNDLPMLERVVVIASRDLVILQQPTPQAGELDGPEWFEAHRAELDEILANLELGPPEDFMSE